jgi:hypothetical protein
MKISLLHALLAIRILSLNVNNILTSTWRRHSIA